MPAFETLLTFFGVSVLLGLTPGPDNLFVLLQSAQRGWRAGMAVVLAFKYRGYSTLGISRNAIA